MKADVIVVGGGHAGARPRRRRPDSAPRRFCVTHRFATIGEMSCNPAIGGLGKGHLVREVDALDGLMGRVADRAGIQFRVLNRRKGPAVRGPRAQADRALYRAAMQAAIRGSREPARSSKARLADLVVESGRVAGVRARATAAASQRAAVVLTTGTFLRGLIHLGETTTPAGRYRRGAEPRAVGDACARGFALGRLKTGTPAAPRRPHDRLGKRSSGSPATCRPSRSRR